MKNISRQNANRQSVIEQSLIEQSVIRQNIIGQNITIKLKALFFVFVFLLSVSCEEGETTLPSSAPEGESATEEEGAMQNASVAVNPSAERFFTVTNDFLNYTGTSGEYLRLKSVGTGQVYIVPPTQYSALELEYVIMEAKVEGECVKVPASAFPVEVGVCQSSKCSAVRSLSVILNNPAHYNLNGIGGLLTPQIYPVSPCSEDFVKVISNVGEYKQL